MAIEKIAYHLGRRDEVPNKELAAELAQTKDVDDIAEIASFLEDKNKSIASDCIVVLYQVGYLAPDLIAPYVGSFLQLLDSKINRMVWGSMIALSTIAGLVPQKIYPHFDRIKHHIQTGTVITNVSGVRTLINLAGTGDPYYADLIDELLDLQKACRNVDFAKRAEEVAAVLKDNDLPQFIEILKARRSDLSKSAQKRLGKLLRSLEE